jgi:hypothetical protein
VVIGQDVQVPCELPGKRVPCARGELVDARIEKGIHGGAFLRGELSELGPARVGIDRVIDERARR